MIIDRIENLEKYAPLLPYAKDIKKALEGDLSVDGKRVIDGENCYYTVSTVKTHAKDVNGYETHRDYADVQVVLSGRERMDAGTDLVERGPYKPDIQFFDGRQTASWLAPAGWFVVFFPGEAHEPLIWAEEGKVETVHKVVFKVRF